MQQLSHYITLHYISVTLQFPAMEVMLHGWGIHHKAAVAMTSLVPF